MAGFNGSAFGRFGGPVRAGMDENAAMVAISATAPLIGRRFSYLVLGGALLLPFGVLGSMVAAFAPDLGTRYLVDGVLIVLVIAVAVPAFGLLPPVQQLELTAAEQLLPTPPLPAAPRTGSARRRVAIWFAAHVVVGALGSCALLSLPLGPVLITERTRDGQLAPAAAFVLLPVVVLAGPGVAVLLGQVMAALAPRALGPSPAERMALLQARAEALEQRNRLAREVHDSVGHALSVVTLQAAAARHVFDRDPEFARTALGAVEETARAAMTELDHVLGLLAHDGPDPAPSDSGTRPEEGTPSLADLDALLARTRLTGVPVDADVDGARALLPRLPADLSQQVYRIVQEALTNAVRHGDGSAIALRLVIGADAVRIDVHNRMAAAHRTLGESGGQAAGAAGRPGRGLIGLRARVQALGGSMSAGPVTGTDPTAGPTDDPAAHPATEPAFACWTLSVHVPLPDPPVSDESATMPG
jgi:signal transduction histidine kinase